MSLVNILLTFTILLGGPVDPKDPFHMNLHQLHQTEYAIIMKAAERNGIGKYDYDNLAVLFAIRVAENGRRGREFGVLHPNALGRDGETWQVTLDRQAGWCAATIMKNRKRWADAGMKESFIVFLGKRYAPVGADNDPKNLNRHWIGNVTREASKYMAFVKKPSVA